MIAVARRAFVIVAALIALGWAMRRMRRESAEQLEQLLAAQQKTARRNPGPVRESERARHAGRRHSGARRTARSSRRDRHRAANHRRCAAMKPRAAWRAPAPPSKKSSRPAGWPAQRPAYSDACTVLRRGARNRRLKKSKSRACEARLLNPAAPVGRNRESSETRAGDSLDSMMSPPNATATAAGDTPVRGRVVLPVSCTIHEARALAGASARAARAAGSLRDRRWRRAAGGHRRRAAGGGVRARLPGAQPAVRLEGALAGARRSHPRARCGRAARDTRPEPHDTRPRAIPRHLLRRELRGARLDGGRAAQALGR